jgi:hypothetical protein
MLMGGSIVPQVEAGTLKRTPLYEAHVAAGAKLVPFAGWEMPVQYDGIREEHIRVRSSCGVFDVSHMGEIETEGPQAAELLQRLLSNDVSKIQVGGAQYSCLCREDGGVLDDLFTYRLGDDRYLTVTNAANHDRDLEWFEAHAVEFEAEVRDRIEAYAMLAVQGPEARQIVERLTDGELPPRFGTAELPVAGCPTLVCGTGYTGEDGVELLMAPEDAATVWEALIGGGGPGSPRHPPSRGELLPLWERPDRGANADRGGARLVRQGGHRLHRVRGMSTGPRGGTEGGPGAVRDDSGRDPAPGQSDRLRRRGGRKGDERDDVPVAGGGDRDGLRPHGSRGARGGD